MEISLRSQLAAGIAVAGAAAIAVTPIVHPDVVPSLERVSANIQISAWADPLSVLGDTLGVLGNAFFGTAPNMTSPPPVSVPGLNGLLPIGDSGLYVRTTDGLIPQLLNGSGTYTAYQPLGPGERFVTKVGQVPGTPLLAAVGTNVSNYAVAGINALGAISDATGALIFGLPLTAFQVIDDLVNGNPIDIGQIIQDTIITPLTDAFDTVITQTSYVINSVIDNVIALLRSVPSLVTGVFQQVLGSTLFLGQQALNTVADSVTALASLDLQDAWNTTVNGFLSPNGVLGNAVKLSVGTGALTGDSDDAVHPEPAPGAHCRYGRRVACHQDLHAAAGGRGEGFARCRGAVRLGCPG